MSYYTQCNFKWIIISRVYVLILLTIGQNLYLKTQLECHRSEYNYKVSLNIPQHPTCFLYNFGCYFTPVSLRTFEWTIFQNSQDFTKFPLTEVSNLYVLFFKRLRCKNGELEYQVKMEDTNYDAKIFGRRTRVRMNESQ